jgi:phosphinothricin acetyltransferase
MPVKKQVLFVCIENAGRSQMAEALARIHGAEFVEPHSSGSRPSGKINPVAIEVMAELGYDLSTHQSKSLDEIPKLEYDAVVTMGCGDACPFVSTKRRFDWNIPDPKGKSLDEVRAIRDGISRQVQDLLAEIGPGPKPEYSVRFARSEHADAVAKIYNHYVRESTITFEEEAVSVTEMVDRIQRVQSTNLPWLIAEENGEIVGFAYASPWKARAAYRHSVEITVYLAPECGGRGIGSALYAELISLLETRGIHAVIGGIALPNDASVALHEKFGMEKVAHFREVGYKFGRWIDVAYWELVLPRKSHSA